MTPTCFVVRGSPNPDAPRVLSFGSRAHHCLGTAPARMALEAMVTGFAAYAGGLQSDFDVIEWRQVRSSWAR